MEDKSLINYISPKKIKLYNTDLQMYHDPSLYPPKNNLYEYQIEPETNEKYEPTLEELLNINIDMLSKSYINDCKRKKYENDYYTEKYSMFNENKSTPQLNFM